METSIKIAKVILTLKDIYYLDDNSTFTIYKNEWERRLYTECSHQKLDRHIASFLNIFIFQHWDNLIQWSEKILKESKNSPVKKDQDKK